VGRLVETPDGRRLAVDWWGPVDGYPVFLLHGTPGSRQGPRPRTRDLHLLGLRLIAYDRPGYGGSTRYPDRQVIHAAADVDAIARELGIGQFSVVGRSGGGPHALACAARLPDKVASAAVLVSLAPFDAKGLNWFDGMTASNIEAYQQAKARGGDLRGLRDRFWDRGKAISGDPGQMIASLSPELSVPDRRIVMEIGVSRMLVDNFRGAFTSADDHHRARDEWTTPVDADDEESAAYGSEGWFDDVVSFTRPWGFDVEDIETPVLLWHGELDRFSPVGHFHWLAEHLRNCTPMMAPGSAHFGAVQALPRVLRWLVDETREAAPTRS